MQISLPSRLDIRSLDQAKCPAGDMTFSGISNKIFVLRLKAFSGFKYKVYSPVVVWSPSTASREKKALVKF